MIIALLGYLTLSFALSTSGQRNLGYGESTKLSHDTDNGDTADLQTDARANLGGEKGDVAIDTTQGIDVDSKHRKDGADVSATADSKNQFHAEAENRPDVDVTADVEVEVEVEIPRVTSLDFPSLPSFILAASNDIHGVQDYADEA